MDQALIPSSKYDSVVSNDELKKQYSFMSVPGLNLVCLGMNMTMDPFEDGRVRQAFIHAVNRAKLVEEITKRGNVPARGILPPGIAGYDPELEIYTYNPQKSRQLLGEAGYPEGKGIPAIEVYPTGPGMNPEERSKRGTINK